jgi:hypothetical protein
MASQRPNDDAMTEDELRQREAVAPPAAIGDVEDAVTPFVGGELTEWRVPRPDRDAGNDHPDE